MKANFQAIIDITNDMVESFKNGLIERDELVLFQAHLVFARSLISNAIRRHYDKDYPDQTARPFKPKNPKSYKPHPKSVGKRSESVTHTEIKNGGE